MQASYLSSRFCLQCNAREAPEGTAQKLLGCGRCKSALMPTDCQRKHWKRHKHFCTSNTESQSDMASKLGTSKKEVTIFADVQPFVEAVQADIGIFMHSILKAFTNESLHDSHLVYLRFAWAPSDDPRHRFKLVSGQLVPIKDLPRFLKSETTPNLVDSLRDVSPALLDARVGSPTPPGKQRVALMWKLSAFNKEGAPHIMNVTPIDLSPDMVRARPLGAGGKDWVAQLKDILAGPPIGVRLSDGSTLVIITPEGSA